VLRCVPRIAIMRVLAFALPDPVPNEVSDPFLLLRQPNVKRRF
jgi:hypothetical protein